MNDTPTPARQAQRVPKDARRPFGSQTQKLAYPEREGFHRHWFSDKPGRIDAAVAAGYTHVIDKEGKRVARPVGVNDAGGAQIGFLMEIPEDWYQEDMERQFAENNKMEEAIKTGSVAGKPGEDGLYVPKDTPIRVTGSKRPS